MSYAVDNFARQPNILKALRDRLVAGRYRFRSLCLLLLLTLVGGSTAARAEVQNAPVTSVGPGAQFAIADFDGDVRPDLASIQAGPNSSGNTNYWIQLQLSAVGRQSIRFVAPAGGLRIEARDVNGDHAVDLVLATAWFNQPVAVLLNNGHGGFSRAEPAAFPEAFSESKTKWASGSYQVTDAIGVPPQSGARICLETRGLPYPRAQAGFVSPSSSGFLLSPFLISSLGRAPPSQVSHL